MEEDVEETARTFLQGLIQRQAKPPTFTLNHNYDLFQPIIYPSCLSVAAE